MKRPTLSAVGLAAIAGAAVTGISSVAGFALNGLLGISGHTTRMFHSGLLIIGWDLIAMALCAWGLPLFALGRAEPDRRPAVGIISGSFLGAVVVVLWVLGDLLAIGARPYGLGLLSPVVPLGPGWSIAAVVTGGAVLSALGAAPVVWSAGRFSSGRTR